MGRSFESVRLSVKSTASRWERALRVLREEDRSCAGGLGAMAKKHSSEGFYAFDDPLEAAVFSAFVEMLIRQDKKKE
jgi:hypothetical protein